MSDRKYKQSGYQDDHRGSRSGSRGGDRQRGPRAPREGPRGRGLGKPTASVVRCAACGGEIEVETEIARDQSCTRCGRDLHTCTNCRHFEPSLPGECRQEIETRVAKKSTRNDCDLFAPKVTQEFSKEQASTNDARSAFDKLFDF